MGNPEPAVTEIGHGLQADPLQPPTPRALVDQAQALAKQAQAFAAYAEDPANEVQIPADQAQTLAYQAQALANQARALVAYKNDVDQAEKSVYEYKEITNLHDINLYYPIHKLALEDWERRVEYLNKSVSRREGQGVELTNQISNVFSVFVVFLGLVLTAVSHLTQANTEVGAAPVCGKIWIPILLTVFATVVTIVGILYKFRSLQSLEFTIQKERQAKIVVAQRANSLRREGPKKFKFTTYSNSRPATNPKLGKKWIWVIVSILIFTFIFILSYFVILCNTWVVQRGQHCLPPSLMRETKLVNKTGGNIDLKEDTARLLSDLSHNLQPEKAKTVKVTSQGITRYWCTKPGNIYDNVVVSNDDCVNYRKIHFRRRANGAYICAGVKRYSLWDFMRLRPLWEVMKLWPPCEVMI